MTGLMQCHSQTDVKAMALHILNHLKITYLLM